MKLLIMLIFFSLSASAGGLGSMYDSSVQSFSRFIGHRGGNFILKYRLLSWEKLQFRRDALSQAIAELRSLVGDTEKSAYLAEQGVDLTNATHILLYEIMEHTVAIHSGLPRTGPGLEDLDYVWILPDGAIDLHGPETLRLGKIGFSKLESSYVPDKTWELYTEWGSEVRAELRRVLEKVPESTLTGKYGRSYTREFFEMFAAEFDLSGTRNVFSLGGGQHGSGSDEYTVKNDLPELVAYGGVKEWYRPRFPASHSFLADITLPEPVAKKLEKMRTFVPEENGL